MFVPEPAIESTAGRPASTFTHSSRTSPRRAGPKENERFRKALTFAGAVAVVALFVVSALASPGSLGRTTAVGTASPQTAPLASAPTARSSPAPNLDSGVLTSCASGSHATAAAGAQGSALRSAASGRPPTGSPPPQSPLFNSQVAPFSVLTGPYAYVAAGAALRDQGYGTINLTWPGHPSTSNLVAAYMIWSLMNNSQPPTYGTLNGVNVTGTWTAYATPSPCWSQTYIYTFIADVTNDVKNGLNQLTNFPSSLTNGYDPWNQSETGILDEGASLIAIYDTGSSELQQVTVYTGALTTTAVTLDAQLNYSTANRTNATTTYIIADGQLPGNAAEWNGTTIDANAFPGDDPHASPYVWSFGNLSDTKTFNVNVSVGSNNTTAAAYPTDGDCFTWVGQVLSVGVAAKPPPYTVTFQEQGLLNGMTWKVTTNGTQKTGTVSGGTSSLKFKVLNGTYNYSVTSVPGYTSSALKGNYTIRGGPLFIRILFHQILYPITFNETGLPNAAEWQVTLSNVSQGLSDLIFTEAPGGILYSEPNGTYNFSVVETGLYLPEPPNGTLTVSGSAITEIIAFVPPPLYNITFRENGLPAGTTWGAYVSSYQWGDFSNSTANRSYSLELPNATLDSDFAYADPVTGFASPGYAYFGVFGVPATIDLNYSPLYLVDLNETGLPTGTEWTAELSGTPGSFSGYSLNSTIEYEVPNGTYTFSVTPVWAYDAVPSTGTITVNGGFAGQLIVFSLSPTYTITFNQTGLPLGTKWSVSLQLPTLKEVTTNSTGANLAFEEPNGSYEFTVGAVAGYSGSPTAGYVYVEGANVSETITYTQVYEVAFSEKGLPSGAAWTIYFDYAYNSSSSPNINFFVPNGSYTFEAYSVGSFVPTPSSGSLEVSGAPLAQLINFSSASEPTYAVTFTESGLPTGTNWSVEYNYYLEWTTGMTLNFTETNGSYYFTVGGAVGYGASPAYGTLNVSGAPAQQTIDFSVPSGLFLVTFTESNLPTGATWYVNITGEPGLVATVAPTTGHSVSISLANATYTFAAATSDKGWTTTAGGKLTVNGGPVSESIPFSGPTPVTSTYEVTIVEQNLPIGVTWYINITGQAGLSATVASSSGTQVSIQLANGSYSYSATSNSKAWTATGSSFSVSGAPQQVTVSYSTSGNSPPSSSSGSPSLPWTWIGVAIAALAAVLLLLFAFYRRRKKEEKPTPTTPSSSPPPKSPPSSPPGPAGKSS